MSSYTNIEWTKKGVAIAPDPSKSWMRTHAMLPTPFQLKDNLYRIYFGGRNDKNQSHVGYADIDITAPDKILATADEALLTPGRLGTFDDNGVLPSCAVRSGNDIYLYYIGFKPGGTTRMDLFGGLSISSDNGKTFNKWSEAPIIGRNRVNPFINTAPWVVQNGKDGWLMYYVSGVEWVHADLPRYNIQIAHSTDGRDWHREGKVAIDFTNGENALARPYVVKDSDGWHMWFSSKGDYYIPHYARSDDGLNWKRVPGEPAITPSAGPDEEMICYPIVLKSGKDLVMFYNGNGYGKNGVCLATGKVRS